MNQPGVLATVAGMLASRAYNIDSLAVGATENPEFSRMTFVVNGNEKTLEQVRKQLSKIVTVVTVQDFSGQDYVERDLMLIKVSTENGRRGEIRELVDIFRGRIVDVGANHVMIEISGRENKIEAFVERMRSLVFSKWFAPVALPCSENGLSLKIRPPTTLCTPPKPPAEALSHRHVNSPRSPPP
jgi:acetolactate synthase-1/3 small subunit